MDLWTIRSREEWKVRSKPESLTLVCSQTSRRMLHFAKSSDEPYSDLCEIGLINVAVPIFSDGDFIGGLVASGTGLSDVPLDDFLVAKSLDLEETQASKLIEQVPIMEAAQADRIAERFVQLLGENHPKNDD